MFVLLMLLRPPISTRTDTLVPYTTRCRSWDVRLQALLGAPFLMARNGCAFRVVRSPFRRGSGRSEATRGMPIRQSLWDGLKIGVRLPDLFSLRMERSDQSKPWLRS